MLSSTMPTHPFVIAIEKAGRGRNKQGGIRRNRFIKNRGVAGPAAEDGRFVANNSDRRSATLSKDRFRGSRIQGLIVLKNRYYNNRQKTLANAFSQFQRPAFGFCKFCIPFPNRKVQCHVSDGPMPRDIS